MIEVRDLTKRFGEARALSHVDLCVETGRIVGLVGSNGAGKSTLLRVLSGVYRPDEGTAAVDGAPVYENVAVKERMIFVPDSPVFEAGATLRSTARLYAAFYPRYDWKKYEKLCGVFPLAEKKRISTMSKGMQRQAALISALSAAPDYLLLDEVFDGLDPVIRRLLKRVIANEVAERGMTVLIASHNLRELEDFCDTVGLLHEGGVLLEKEIDELHLGMHRVQVVFAQPVSDEALRAALDVVSLERTGTLVTLVLRGEREAAEEKLAALRPVFCEFLPLSLEEVFISEMESVGYDAARVLE